MIDRSGLLTEQRLADSARLDEMSIADAVRLMNQQDRAAVDAVSAESRNIVRAIELVVDRLQRGGRLIYIGAGTSGRLGVLDASECPPTFRTDPSLVQGIIAGGESAMFRAVEGAEDSADDGAGDIAARNLSTSDAVVGIATGGTTPYVHGAIRKAKELGAGTIFLSCVGPFEGEPAADVVIRVLVGAEVLTGSTRLKAGTATKLVLNTISTVAMVRLGKVYENLMVDMRAGNAKLRDRAARIVAMITGESRQAAAQWLDRADGHVKVAIVMCRRNVSAQEAQSLLAASSGHLRPVIS
jgi:N-acetylmuramic acid 6-phosphate etherase